MLRAESIGVFDCSSPFRRWLRRFTLSSGCVLTLACGADSTTMRDTRPQAMPPQTPQTPPPQAGMSSPIDNPMPGTGGNPSVVPIFDAGMRDAASCVRCEPPGGQYCGVIGDGCGGEQDCGACKTQGFTCGGRGIEHVCGALPDSGACIPLICEGPSGKYCGKLGDNCGGEVDCGGCPAGQDCGGAGLPGICGIDPSSGKCTPAVCSVGGAQYCNAIGDDCGGRTECGACPMGQECGARIERLCGAPCPLCKQIEKCMSGTTTVRGTAVTGALMNADPLYNAVVYVPNIAAGTKLEPLKDGPSCDRCTPLTLDNSIASAITGPDGTFELKDVPAGDDIPLVVQLGGWRMQTTIKVTPCMENVLPAGSVRLPRNRTEGDIPMTAISTGNVDRLQCLLRKLGIEDSEFGNPGGPQRIQFYTSNGSRIDTSTPPEASLVGTTIGGGAWSKYTQVIFPCEGAEVAKSPEAQANMLDYVNKGGRVFATHYSYTWLFRNGPLATTATWQAQLSQNPASLTATIDTGFKKGTDLAKWLELTGALSSIMPPQLSISEPRQDVAAIPAMGGGQRWIYSDMPATIQQFTIETPVLATPDKTCGRVVFSDFHVLNARTQGMTFPAECDTNPLTPQEKVLAFMLFDLASCIGPNTPPAPPPPPPPPPPAAPPPPLPPPPVM